jgi:kynureninase
MKFDITKNCAIKLDNNDPLSSYRKEFYYPKTNNDEEGIYLCGNSLGLQPKSVQNHIDKELNIWQKQGALGQHSRWEHFHERLTETTARLVGAENSEIVVMNALTVNLHLLMISFYQPTDNRYKIIVEAGAFPSDQYAIDSQIKLHGLEPKNTIIELKPRENEYSLRTEDIVNTIENCGDKLSMVLMGGVNYYTGQAFDLKTIAQAAHSVDAIAGFDFAHGAGNLDLDLHNWEVDFAVWCSYKYLCGGPGSPGGVFVHEKHENWDGPRFNGWWGNKKTTRFIMDSKFDPMVGAEGWQISNAPILAMACLRSSMAIFSDAGMPAIIKKSKKLTGYLEYLIGSLEDKIKIITPKDSKQRGAQLSIVVKKNAKEVFDSLNSNHIICDWREPDVIRVAPVPLYNSFVDAYRFYEIVKDLKK